MSGESAFDALMTRRNGEPLPEPTCPHFSRDHEGKCWACAYDEHERAEKAEAWDEGKWAAYSAERDGGDGSEVINPYRFPSITTHPHNPPALGQREDG
ncbi:MAG: hypothetical protein ACXVGA_08570 [Mycobacteriaceae bacterium]